MQRTIVLVDGEIPARGEVLEILADAGYIAETATTGRAALALMVAIERPVVLVLDRRLPEMSAREFVAHWEDDARLAGAVMVMLSAGPVSRRQLVAALSYACSEADRGAEAMLKHRETRAPPG